MLIIPKKELVNVAILYYRLDFASILQSFYWEVIDEIPNIPKVHKFLNYWREVIKVPICEVQVCSSVTQKQFRFEKVPIE